ncbi:MAG: ribonuclease E/G [Alphaproteobacteria bacterium]|nr:ribonuclease E/G [Alphaproteobacteria bacterium]
MIDTLVFEKRDSLSAIALLVEGDLRELEFNDSNKVSEGDVFLGKITHKLDLANGKTGFFVDIKDDKDAFLNLEEQGVEEKNLTEGQSLIVQVLQEAREEKGAKVARGIKLAGTNLVYCPYSMGVFLSSKIKEHENANDYKQFVVENTTGQEGWVLRTSSVEVSLEVLKEEMVELRKVYEEIRNKAKKDKAPSLLYSKGNVLYSYIETYKKSLRRIVVNSHNVEKELIELFGDKFEIEYQAEPFEEYGLEEAINDALMKEVKLKNGGRITIEETRACVAIDVDSGDDRGNGSIARLNSEAATEIAKQIRLRNLSGKIIIDFAGSSDYKYIKPVLDVLAEEMQKDSNMGYLVGLSRAGNVEILRSRRRPSLRDLLTTECECCQGTGRVCD